MRPLLIGITLLILAVSACADTLTADFTTRYDPNTHLFSQVASAGTLTLTLNPNGTIAATLVSNGAGISMFGANTGVYNNTTSALGCLPTHGTNAFGSYDTALVTHTGGPCGTTLTFTIGTVGEFNSVYQLTTGIGYDQVHFGAPPPVTQFWMLTGVVNALGSENYGANANAPVPEPSSLLLLGSGLLGLGRIVRHRIV